MYVVFEREAREFQSFHFFCALQLCHLNSYSNTGTKEYSSSLDDTTRTMRSYGLFRGVSTQSRGKVSGRCACRAPRDFVRKSISLYECEMCGWHDG